MKEVTLKELFDYKDSVSLFKDDALTLVENNPMTIGWGSMGVLWSRTVATVYIHKTRYSKELFDEANSFSINFFSDEYKNALDICGRVSGRDTDKVKLCGFNVEYIDNTPYIKEAKMVLILKKIGQADMDINNVPDNIKPWYKKDGPHTMYVGEVIKVLKNE